MPLSPIRVDLSVHEQSLEDLRESSPIISICVRTPEARSVAESSPVVNSDNRAAANDDDDDDGRGAGR